MKKIFVVLPAILLSVSGAFAGGSSVSSLEMSCEYDLCKRSDALTDKRVQSEYKCKSKTMAINETATVNFKGGAEPVVAGRMAADACYKKLGSQMINKYNKDYVQIGSGKHHSLKMVTIK